VLIDDTYNASPTSAVAALETLRDLPLEQTAKRFVVLGDMLELGNLSVTGHERVGRTAVDCGIDYLVFVGELMGDAEKAALAAGQPKDSVSHFSSAEEAGRFVQNKMRKGDAVLVKGSRGLRMERVVRELMAEPMEADHVLVSVEKDWRY
jgi:UDP-N-acetylmuramoyl-tripeptide--D-alanyl-D-alanine ligase